MQYFCEMLDDSKMSLLFIQSQLKMNSYARQDGAQHSKQLEFEVAKTVSVCGATVETKLVRSHLFLRQLQPRICLLSMH